MFCALSGEAPEEPVVSQKSGHLFEKRLILKYIQEHHRDPVNGEELTENDLITLKSTHKIVKPRPPVASSVPNLLLSLQNEWDAVMLETYQLKHQYHQVRQELSNALYENDAAKRVIARLIREKDEARKALAAFKANYGTAPTAAADSMDIDESPAPNSDDGIKVVHAKLDARARELTATRKKRKPAPTCATADQIRGYTEIAQVDGLHSASAATSGIVAVDALSANVGGVHREWVATAGRDGHALVVDWQNDGKILVDSKVSTKKINSILWRSFGEDAAQASFLTAGVDKTIKYHVLASSDDTSFTVDTKYGFKPHTAEITALALHATGDYVVSASTDKTWGLHDINNGSTIFSVKHESVTSGYTAASLHPDGLILGTGGADSVVRLWDVKSRDNVGAFEGHKGKIKGIAFSENGYYLATCADGEAVVKFWDLRKLTNFHTINIENNLGNGVQDIAFDYSGQYLSAACGKEVRIFHVKKWDELCNITAHTGEVSSVKFGTDAKYLVSSGKDRKIVINGVPQ
ncbi:hypothetical protein HDU85_003515 [Gaertneriomyces sp. JEL0708]|nr:hypothetical protein HDU85_003515 [Gaertneriomyces sp. JEL0708]